MAKTAIIRARTEPTIKAKAERIFLKLGMTSTEAITLFHTQVGLHEGLPFPVTIPNATTRRTFEESDRGEDIKTFRNIDEMFKDLDS